MINKCDIINRHIIEKAKQSGQETADFILDFHVRWNTTYLMLVRFYNLKVIVDEITCNPQLIQGIKKQHLEKLRKINFKQDDWASINVLINVLKPFYQASVMLQGQKYHTLSMSKVIETTLIDFYINLKSVTDNTQEFFVSEILIDFLKKHLVEKISSDQKELSLVITVRTLFLINSYLRALVF